MAAKNLTNARILIVEEQPLALSYMKQSLEQLGFKRLTIAETAAATKELCLSNKFDLILCSFNLSKEQDGYQLYEELKAKRLIKQSTGFIFISAETSGPLVHSVLELQPDDFLVKPFNVYELKSRIEKIIRRKQTLGKLYTLLDDGNDSKALKYIEARLADDNRSYSAILLRLKGDALLRLKRHDEAKAFFKSVLEIQKFTWARIGLVEALIADGDYSLAQRMLKTMLQKPETRLVAYDLLSKLEIRLAEYEQAQEYLYSATEMAPRNIPRQQTLANVAKLNHDYETSYNAQKEIAKFAPHSIHDTPDIYLNAARAGIDFALTTDRSEEINRITRQTSQFLGEMKTLFPNARRQSQIDVLNARIHYLKDEFEQAKELMAQLEEEDDQIRSVDAALDKAKAFHELGFQHKAQALYSQIISHCERHPNISDPITLKMIQQSQVESRDIQMGPKELNNHAVNTFKKGNLALALEAFAQAFRIMPRNISIALNLFQCLCETVEKEGGTYNSSLANKCHALLKKGKLNQEQQERLKKLEKKYATLGLRLDE